MRALDLHLKWYVYQSYESFINISRPTLHQWREIYLTTGSTTQSANIPPPQTSKIKNWEEFEKFVEDTK